MSTPKTHWKNDKQRGCGEDGKFTLLFDDNKSMGTFKRALEATPPRFQMALNECRHDGSLRLSGTSLEAWELILYHVKYNAPTSYTSNEFESTDTLVTTSLLCEILSLCVSRSMF